MKIYHNQIALGTDKMKTSPTIGRKATTHKKTPLATPVGSTPALPVGRLNKEVDKSELNESASPNVKGENVVEPEETRKVPMEEIGTLIKLPSTGLG